MRITHPPKLQWGQPGICRECSRDEFASAPVAAIGHEDPQKMIETKPKLSSVARPRPLKRLTTSQNSRAALRADPAASVKANGRAAGECDAAPTFDCRT